LSDFKSRLMIEHGELNDRVIKLRTFLWGELFNGLETGDKGLLIKQLAFMEAYELVLATRISQL
jgi:hypothetical protein